MATAASRRKQAQEAFGDADTEASKKLHKQKASLKELGHKSVEAAEVDQHLSTCGQGAARGLVISCALLLALCCLHSSPVVGDLVRASVIVLSAFVLFTTGLAYWTKVIPVMITHA